MSFNAFILPCFSVDSVAIISIFFKLKAYQGLLNDLWHKVQSGFSLGCNLLETLAIVRLCHLVRSQALGGFKRVGQWLHASRIDAVQLLHKGQDIRQIAGISRDVIDLDSQSCKMGNLLNSCGIKRHGHPVVSRSGKKSGAQR